MPARQAFVVQMVEDRADLSNAIALNSSMVNGARLIGPSLAGIIIAAFGEGYCFLIDGFSYIAVIVSLLLMHIARQQPRSHRSRVSHELKEGWSYALHFAPIRSLLLLLGLVSLVGMPYSVLMPIFAGTRVAWWPAYAGIPDGRCRCGRARRRAGVSDQALGRGLGPCNRHDFGRLRIGTGGLLQFALAPAFAGADDVHRLLHDDADGVVNTILQTIVEEDKRGRVMSFYSIAFQGTAPFGSLIAGAAASRIGAPRTLMIGGSLCVVGAAWF